ncbi:hypothetical protein CBM2599_A10305 [Cupriavidus taiwanensis]|nr:hypothetical protein CBM2599_A10305 [Cupriavidus taiwanensis]SOY80494.1 hypothetical protein CBM2600_A10151 [Cupriavidus taiwanensis]
MRVVRIDDLDLLARRRTLNAQLKEEQSFYKQYGTPGQYKAATEAVETSAKALIDAQKVVDASKAADSDLEKKNKALADAKAKLFVESTFRLCRLSRINISMRHCSTRASIPCSLQPYFRARIQHKKTASYCRR